jgi:hypothetical protein
MGFLTPLMEMYENRNMDLHAIIANEVFYRFIIANGIDNKE